MCRRRKKRRVRKFRYHGIVNRNFILAAHSVEELTKKASLALKGCKTPCSHMTVFDHENGTHFTLIRKQRKSPWNHILRGTWKKEKTA